MGGFCGYILHYTDAYQLKSAYFLIAEYYISDFSNSFEQRKNPTSVLKLGCPYYKRAE